MGTIDNIKLGAAIIFSAISLTINSALVLAAAGIEPFYSSFTNVAEFPVGVSVNWPAIIGFVCAIIAVFLIMSGHSDNL